MTTIIDHAISIPSPPAAVWKVISQLETIPRWQTDFKQVAFLTTALRGPGARIRCVGTNDKAVIMEITTWYEGLGYEYQIIDGIGISENKGRIRLQEIAEGTIVQWTLSYDVGGVLGSLRNSMGLKRSLENQMIESLRQLYRVLRDNTEEFDMASVKSLMQDGPSVEQRARYKPRHPSRYEENRLRERTAAALRSPGMPPRRPIIEEPLPKEDDTRPNPKVTPAEPAVREPAAPTLEELLKPVRREPPSIVTDTPAVTMPSRFSDVSFTPAPPPPPQIPTVPDAKPAPQPAPVPMPLSDMPAAKAEPNLLPEREKTPQASSTTTSVHPVIPTDKLDTGKISVFEVFGLPKPSETQQIKAANLTVDEVRHEQLAAPTERHMAQVEAPPKTTDTPQARQQFMAGTPIRGDIDPPDHSGRSGLRLKQRRNLLALRRPK